MTRNRRKTMKKMEYEEVEEVAGRRRKEKEE